jgi:hypothetical protein
LEEKLAAPVYKTEIDGGVSSANLTLRDASIRKSWHEIFADKWRSLVGIFRF